MTPPIRLRIEQLVLHGFDPRDRHAIGEALRAELATERQSDSTISHIRDVRGIAAVIARQIKTKVRS
jgi:hypothetical protein